MSGLPTFRWKESCPMGSPTHYPLNFWPLCYLFPDGPGATFGGECLILRLVDCCWQGWIQQEGYLGEAMPIFFCLVRGQGERYLRVAYITDAPRGRK